MNNKAHLRPKDYDSNGDIIPSDWEEEKGDLISRSALLKAMEEERQFLLARDQTGAEHILVHHCLPLIDNASTVSPDVAQLLAFEWGMASVKRPEGKWLIVKHDNEGIHEIACPFCKYSKGSDFFVYFNCYI